MSLTKPFGSKVSARVNRIIRRLRVKELARVPRMNRSATIGVAAIVVLVTAMVFASHESSARKDVKQAPRAAANTPAAESAAQPSADKSTPVTIAGCLERDDQTFRLKDTAGADAPKARSWKSGFLKKGSASIAVVDAANRLKLNNYVGQRVSLTGTLVDREMHPRLLQRVAPSCASGKPAKSDAL